MRKHCLGDSNYKCSSFAMCLRKLSRFTWLISFKVGLKTRSISAIYSMHHLEYASKFIVIWNVEDSLPMENSADHWISLLLMQVDFNSLWLKVMKIISYSSCIYFLIRSWFSSSWNNILYLLSLPITFVFVGESE